MNEEQLKKLSDTDLEHYANGEMDKMSDAGLAILAGDPNPAPKPGEGANTSSSILPALWDEAKGFANGLVRTASFDNKKDLIKHNSPTAENLGNVLGTTGMGFLEGLAALKLIPKGTPAAKSALARVLSNSAISAGSAAARPGSEEGSRLENAGMWGLGSALTSGTLESILHSPPLARFGGRILGGLSTNEAQAWRDNPEGAARLATLLNTNPEKLGDEVQTLLKGQRVYGGYKGGIVGKGGALDRMSTAPMKAEKGKIMANYGQDISLPLDTFSGSSPEVQSELQRILNLNAESPRVETVIQRSPERLNIFREKGPGTPIHRMISDETRFERVIPPRPRANVVLTPGQQSTLMNLTGDETWKDAAKLNPVEYKKVADANNSAWQSLRAAQEEAILNAQTKMRSQVASAHAQNPDFVGLPDESYFQENLAKFPELNKNINRDINYSSRAGKIEPRTLVTAGPKTDAADIRDYLDRYSGSNLQRMADELAAGQKLTTTKGVSGFGNYFRRPVSSRLIRTPDFSNKTKDLVGLPLLQAILNGGQAVPGDWLGD